VGQSLHFIPTPIPGALVIDSVFRKDDRGHFLRAWCIKEFTEEGINFIPVQANIGSSRQKGTTRGMHFQISPAPEAKLVRCTRGSLFDVVVDLREDSSTLYKWYGVELNANSCQMLYVPEGCAHGYQTLEDDTDLYYMTSQYYAPSAAKGVRFDDPAFGVVWPLEPTSMSEQDRNWPLIGEGSSR